MFIDTLYVFWNDQKVGTIFRKEFGKYYIDFSYDPEWKQNGWPISHSLPLDIEETLDARKRENLITYFFSNLLPTGIDRNHHARVARVDPNDLLSVLGTMLKECAGALVFSPLDMPPPVGSTRNFRAVPIEKYLIRRKSGQTQRTLRSLFSNGDVVAGSQDKLCCLVDPNGNIVVPEQDSSLLSTHILKPMWSFADNEHFCLRFAEVCGLNSAKSQIVKVGDEPMVAILRYDRLGGLRLHQENFCQALGLPEYYEDVASDATLENICWFAHENLGEKSCEKIAELALFNVIIGNTDTHAKNISILRGLDGEWSLALFYDLACLTAEDFSDDFSLRIENAKNIKELTEDCLFQFADECHIPSEKLMQIAKNLLKKVKENIDPHLRRMVSELPESEEKFKIIAETIKENIKTLEPIVSKFCELVEEDLEKEKICLFLDQ